jgi:phage-related protein
MPVVGEAHIIVRAITTNVSKDISRGFSGLSGSGGGKQAEKAGQDLSSKFMRGFNKGGKDTSFLSNFAAGLKDMNPAVEQGYQSFQQLIMTGYKSSAMAGIFISSIGALIGALVALVGAAIGAAASFTAVIGLFLSLKVATSVAKMAFEGIGEAVQQATQAQKTHAQTLKDVREELQQLKFDAEDAALSEESAAIALEKAREGLARTADLPADSRARREAELSYKQAELNYRRAKDKNNDLQEELKTGAKARAAAAAKDPYAALTTSQKGFAKFLVSLQPIMKGLREAVASGFLPLLQKGISNLLASGSFNAIYNGIKSIGDALGKAVKPLFEFLSSTEAAGYLNQIFSDMAYVVKQFGPILTKFFGIFLKIMAASGPIVRKFADYILQMLTNFKDFLDKTGDTKLTEFFITAADMAGKFGKIFGNIFNGLMGIVEANFGPGTGGDILLNWLAEATSSFGTFGGQGKAQLSTFFQSVALNAKAMLSGVGGIITEIIKLGADPKVGMFWKTVKESTPQIGEILKKANSAMPIIGRILGKIIDIVNKLVDSGAVDNYFNTLLGGATVVDNILNNKVIGSVQEFTGRVHAVTTAFQKLTQIAGPVGDFLLGGMTKYAGVLGGVIDFSKGVFEGTKKIIDGMDGMGGKVKKTMDSFKAASGIWPKYKKGVNQARDFTGLLSKKSGGFLKNATAQTRKLATSQNIFSRYLGKTTALYEAGGVRFKIFKTRALTGFAEMTKSNNKFVSAFGKGGTFMLKHPILIIIGALIAIFAVMYTTNENFKKQIDNTFKPALDTLKAAWEQILIALQPVFVAFKGFIGATGETSNEASGLALVFIAITTAIAGLIQFLAPLIVAIVKFLAPGIEFLINMFSFLNANVIAPLIPAIAIFTAIIYGLNAAVALNSKIVAINKTGWGVWFKQLKIVTFFTKIAKLVQGAFSAVIGANPIVLITIAIVALIAAIIWLTTNTTFFQDAWAALTVAWQASIDAIGMAFNWVMGIIKSVWEWIVANWPLLLAIITGPIGMAVYLIMNNLDAIIGFFQAAFKFIGDIIMGYINFWIGIFVFLGTGIMNVFMAIPNAIVTAFNFVVNFFKNFVNTGIGLFEGFINFVLGGINRLIGALNTLKITIPDWVPFVGGQTWGISIPEIPMLKLPRLAKGGIVNPSIGGSLVNIAEAGKPEKVTPLDSNGLSAGDRAVLAAVSGGGSGGMNITVNAAPGMDVNALAAEVGRKLAFQMRKGAYS